MRGVKTTVHMEQALAEAVRAFHAVLDQYTLADLVANRAQLAKVLVYERKAS